MNRNASFVGSDFRRPCPDNSLPFGTARFLFAFAGLLSIASAQSASWAEPRALPNIVLILADDLGWSDVGCYGGEIPTPHLDALAERGLRFLQFYNNSVCGPSRASLLTGLYAQRVGHSGTHWNQPTDFSRCLTLGEALQRAGYRALAVGKWQDPDLPARRGFDRFYGPMCSGKISYFHEVGTNPFFLDETRVSLPEDFYLTDALSDHALRFLDEAQADPKTRDRPFFSRSPTWHRIGRCTPARRTLRRIGNVTGGKAGIHGTKPAWNVSAARA